MEPSDSPQVRISSEAENAAQIILGFYTLVAFLSLRKEVLASSIGGVRNSLSFANYILL